MQDGSLVLGGGRVESLSYQSTGQKVCTFLEGNEYRKQEGSPALLTTEHLAGRGSAPRPLPSHVFPVSVQVPQADVNGTTGRVQPPGELGSAQVA